MKKYELSIFVTIMVVAILLVMGSLTSPIQASNFYAISLTPTSTAISRQDSQGETLPEEQQEELKDLIQAYFEMRYDAHSVSHPNGFNLNGFDDLVSKRPDAEAFLTAELSKLALENKYAELNHSRYVDYKYFLDFRGFAFDTATQLVGRLARVYP